MAPKSKLPPMPEKARAARVASPKADSEAPARKSKAAAPQTAVATRKPRAVAAVSEFDDLSNLAMETKLYEDDIRAQTGNTNTWIKTIQGGAPEITRGSSSLIKGAEAGDFLIPLAEGKFAAKETLRVTVLGMFKVYTEKKPAPMKNGQKLGMDMTVSFWLPDDAEQIPLADGDNFRRNLSNGNFLAPMHWVFVYLHEFPQIKDALIPFQSVGNSYYTKLMKLVKAKSSVSTEIVIDLKCVPVENADYATTNYYIEAEFVGNNYDLSVDPDTGAGKVTLLKGGMKAEQVREILELSKKMLREYKEARLVSKRSQQQLLAFVGPAGNAAPRAHTGLPGSGKGGYAEDDSSADAPKF